MSLCHDLQCVDDLTIKAIKVPVEMAAHGDERVVEASEFFKAHAPVVECSDHGATRGRA